jgi:nitrogen fixation/metabolism regulation signal transduction histidine kinase
MLVYFVAIWNFLWWFGIVYDHLVHFVSIWYVFPVLVSCTKKNLATLTKNVKYVPCRVFTMCTYVHCNAVIFVALFLLLVRRMKKIIGHSHLAEKWESRLCKHLTALEMTVLSQILSKCFIGSGVVVINTCTEINVYVS